MIIVAGEALVDLIVHPDGRLTAVPGGGPYNTARTIGRLGGVVSFLCSEEGRWVNAQRVEASGGMFI